MQQVVSSEYEWLPSGMSLYHTYLKYWNVNHLSRDHFLARFRHILAFFCKKSHQNSRSEIKNRTLIFFSFHAVKFLFCTCGSFRDYQTVLFDRFLNYCGAKIHTHTTAGNHSLICIIGTLYRKKSLSVSGK